jgi:flavin-dependent dehydrogenase
MVRAAESRGAVFWAASRASLGAAEHDGRLVRVSRAGVRTEVMARVVIDATGLGRGLAHDGVRAERVAAGSRVGLGAVFDGARYPVEAGDLHMAVGRSGYVGLVRVEDGALNVAAAVDPAPLRSSPAGRVVSAVLVEAGLPPFGEDPLLGWRGTPLLTRSRADVGDERLLRVGDAAGYVEPFTGEGMCWALTMGRAVAAVAARAVEEWSEDLLALWGSYHHKGLVPSQRLCSGLARALRRPWLVAPAVAVLGLAPGIAAPFVGRAARAPAIWAEVGA